jgi:hypothetical protein
MRSTIVMLTMLAVLAAIAGVLIRSPAEASQPMISGIEAQLQARRDEIQRAQRRRRPRFWDCSVMLGGANDEEDETEDRCSPEVEDRP